MTALYGGASAGLGREVRRHRRMGAFSAQEQFEDALPPGLVSRPASGTWSRDRVYGLARTFWGFVWQAVHVHAPCRAVVRQVQTALAGSGVRVDGSTSAYCQARSRLPMALMQRAMEGAARSADREAPDGAGTINGRRVRVVDASSVQIADTEANRRAYPCPSGVREGCGFPAMGFIALCSLASGAVQRIATARPTTHDYKLFRLLWRHLEPGDIVLGDRAFCAFEAFATLSARGVDMLARLHQSRKPEPGRMRRIGRDDYLAVWERPKTIPPRSAMTRGEFDALPKAATVRLVFANVERCGFRTKQIWLATTLLDPLPYPAEGLVALYLRRWSIELCFRDIKTTMRMERLRCLKPDMARKELLAFLTAHNLVRLLTARAARLRGGDPSRISFKGAVDALCVSFAYGACAVSKRHVRPLDVLLELIAQDIVPLRPNRTEPRAVKQRRKNYQLLTKPRHEFKEIPHRSTYKRKVSNALS